MTDSDVTAVIAQQHEETKQALRGLLDHRGPERADLFRKLRVTMALHETAEALTVHPEAVRQLGGTDRAILDLVAEESEAGRLIGRLELLDIDSDAFVSGFEELAASAIRHAQSEEADEWPALREITDMAANERMVAVTSAVPRLAEDPHGLAQDANFSQMLGWAEGELAREVEPDNVANDPTSSDSPDPYTTEATEADGATAAASDSGEADAKPTADTTSDDATSVTTTTDAVDVPTTFDRIGVDGETRTLEFDPPEAESSDA